MHDGAGFEYVPVDPDQSQGGVAATFPGEGLSPEEFSEEFGYGMATLFEQHVIAPRENEFVDPNAAALETMTDTERQAWDTALYGTPVDAAPAGANVEQREAEVEEGFFYGGGCDGEASEAVYGDREEQAQEFDSLFEDYDERLRSDRRIVDADDAWRSRMAERGYDFDDLSDAPDSVQQRMQDEVFAEIDPTFGLPEEELATLSPEQLDALLNQDQGEADPAVVAEIAAYELDVAGADFACAADIREATAAIGQDFLDEHRAELERYRDVVAEQSGVG